MATTQDQEDDEDDINPITMLFPADGHHHPNNGVLFPAREVEETSTDQYDISSIKSTLLIRQLPSQGLSFQLWPAARTLVSLLDLYRTHPTHSPLAPILPDGRDHRHLSILELGSGTGLVGIAAAVILGANVTLTDLPHVIPNLQFNAHANANLLSLQGGTAHVAPLRWGEADDVNVIEREFDLILASDVVYHDHLYDPLLETLRLFLNSGKEKKKMTFVMAHLRRWKKDSVFFKKAKKMFDVQTIHVDPPCNGARIGVVVYSFYGKTEKNMKNPC
ncbi:protein N-lysine methyltransferase METTL21A-like [Pistacia vera]|uniref:protein N-lysine methyltransferase METTL21A-like n=1 Tax=Pistacia vera TaxID=55513 RepID=UPI001263B4A0|nr:protein N-lysine methyltransferase METTL21A-like [Pistacia vera]